MIEHVSSRDPYLLTRKYGEIIGLVKEVNQTDEEYKNRVCVELRVRGSYQQAHEALWGYEFDDRDQAFEGPFLGVLGATLLSLEGDVLVEDGFLQIQKDIQRGEVFVAENPSHIGISKMIKLLGATMPLWEMKEEYKKELV